MIHQGSGSITIWGNGHGTQLLTGCGVQSGSFGTNAHHVGMRLQDSKCGWARLEPRIVQVFCYDPIGLSLATLIKSSKQVGQAAICGLLPKMIKSRR